MSRFEGTDRYIATDDLKVAVNAAVALERPLLIKGEPGTGKTVLAYEIAKAFDAPLITWHVKSTTKAHNGLYEYDAVSRLRDSQLGEERVHDVRNYLKKGKLWEAFTAPARPVLLIDEIDKADIEFPNDLLQELDRMEFYVQETDETIRAEVRPIVIITSNNEKELPDAFLRRCFFHFIRFPRRGHPVGHRRCPLPRHQAAPGRRGVEDLLRDPRHAGPEEEAVHLRTAGLAETAAGRRHRRRNAQGKDAQSPDPAPARRPSEKRAGRASVRATGFPEPPRRRASRRLKPALPRFHWNARLRRAE